MRHLTPLEVISLYAPHDYTLNCLFVAVEAELGKDEIMAVVAPRPDATLRARATDIRPEFDTDQTVLRLRQVFYR